MESYNMFLYHKRMELGLKMRNFAKKLGIGLIKYDLIENGYLKPGKKEIIKISEALNIDYGPYTQGEYSYPGEKEYKRKYFKKVYDFLGSKFFRIFTGIICVISLALLVFFIIQYVGATRYEKTFYSDSYVNFYKKFLDESSPSFSVTNSLMRPELYKVQDDKFISMKGEYNNQNVGDLDFMTVYYTDGYRCIVKGKVVNTSYSMFNATITDYSSMKNVLVSYDCTDGNYELLSKPSEYDDAVKQYSMTFFNDYDLLISEELNIDTPILDLIRDMGYTSYEIRIVTSFSKIGYVFISIIVLISLFCFIFSFVYGTKNGVERTHSHGLIIHHEGLIKPKGDWRFTPFIPETVFEIIGIVVLAIASLRYQIYISAALNPAGIGMSISEIRNMYDPYMMCFYTGMFLLYFIDFDLFLEDKRVIRNIFIYLFLFIGVYVLEITLLESMNDQTLFFSIIRNRLPNMFGTISMYFLITYFLYFTPKFVNTKRKVIVFRCLSIIPVIVIVSTYIIFHGANTTFGWDLPNWAYYLFASERITFSLLCVTYLYGLFFLRLFFKKKFGDEIAANYFNGNKFLFMKNVLICAIIVVISVIDLLVARNSAAKSWGFGYTYFTLFLIPLLLFYHPHKGPRNKLVDYIMLALYAFALSGLLSLFVPIM